MNAPSPERYLLACFLFATIVGTPWAETLKSYELGNAIVGDVGDDVQPVLTKFNTFIFGPSYGMDLVDEGNVESGGIELLDFANIEDFARGQPNSTWERSLPF